MSTTSRSELGINVPVGVLALVAGHYLLPRTRERAIGARVASAVLLAFAVLALATTARGGRTAGTG